MKATKIADALPLYCDLRRHNKGFRNSETFDVQRSIVRWLSHKSIVTKQDCKHFCHAAAYG